MAGFFGLFDYSKPGKGVSKDAPKKPRFLFFWELFFRKFWRIVTLNLLFVVSCLPIVTIAPASAGLIYVARNMANEQPVFLLSDYLDAIKTNLKQSIIFGVIAVVASFVLGVSMRFYYLGLSENQWMMIPLSLCLLIALILVFMSFYIMLMIVTLDLPIRAILKNAAILSIVCLKTNFITLFFVLLILAVVFIFPIIGLLLVILIVPAMISFIVCFNMYPQIERYAINPYVQKLIDENALEKQNDDNDAPLFSDSEINHKP